MGQERTPAVRRTQRVWCRILLPVVETVLATDLVNPRGRARATVTTFAAAQSLSNQVVAGWWRRRTTRRGACLTSSEASVVSYTSCSLSTDRCSRSWVGAHSWLLSRSSRNLSSLKSRHARVLTSTNCSGDRGNGSSNRTSEWSENSSVERTSITGGGKSARVMTTSSVCPSRCVGVHTNWQRTNVSSSSCNRYWVIFTIFSFSLHMRINGYLCTS